jgi:hypothetical protein
MCHVLRCVVCGRPTYTSHNLSYMQALYHRMHLQELCHPPVVWYQTGRPAARRGNVWAVDYAR